MSDQRQPTLFPLPVPEEVGPSCPVDPERGLRVRRADRSQLEWGRIDVEAAMPEDHPVRAIQVLIERLDLRVMKMGDGGFRPAYNVQLATTADQARVIVGVEVTHRGSDMGESTPMIEQIEERTGVRPKEILVDGGYQSHQAIDEAAALGVTVYARLPKPRKDDEADPHAPKEGDSCAVAAWRARMGTEEAKEIYKRRGATAETVNADGKAHRGLGQTALRGLDKVKGGALLFALTYNILRWIRSAPADRSFPSKKESSRRGRGVCGAGSPSATAGSQLATQEPVSDL